jgi:hypothetical protein
LVDAQIEQVIIKDFGVQGNIYWGKVDRCQTCHVAADKGGFEDVAQVFGLQVVADDAAKNAAIAKDAKLAGVVVTENEKQYYQIMYGTHPRRAELFGSHPVEKFGCTSCHGGDGRGLQIRGLEYGSFKKFADLKIPYIPSCTNFITIYCAKSQFLNNQLLEQGIIVRPIDNFLLTPL